MTRASTTEIGSMRATVAHPGRELEAIQTGDIARDGGRETMSERTKRLYRTREGMRLARTALRGAGTLQQVADALPRRVASSTVGSWVTRTVCPELRGFFMVLLGEAPWSSKEVAEGLRVLAALNGDESTTARALAEMCLEAVEARELLDAPLHQRIERFRYLATQRHEANARETAACERGAPDTPDLMRREAWTQVEAATHWNVLEQVDGLDPLAVLQGAV